MIDLKKEPDIYYGFFHELPDGRIAYAYGVNSVYREVYYNFNDDDDDNEKHTVSYEEYFTWKLRKDIYDFPNAKDPRLPYSFDLLFDIKRKSELILTLIKLENKIKSLNECINDHNIIITDEEKEKIRKEYNI